MQDCKVNILGTEYQILTQSEKDNPKLETCNGLCEQYSKKIILNDIYDKYSDPVFGYIICYYLVHYLMDGNGHKKAGTVDDGTRQAHMKKTRK